MDFNADDAMKAAAVQDAANAGLLNEDDYSVPGSHRYLWIKQRDDGTHYIDFNGLPTGSAKEVTSWADTVNGATHDPDPNLKSVQDGFSGMYSDGRAKGGEAAGKLK